MAGSVDFSTHGLVYKQLLKALQKKRPTQRKLPIIPDMLEWFFGHVKFAWGDHRFQMVWSALMLGFMFLLRGSEIRNLKWCDMSICEEQNTPYLMICIQKSKTDQEGKGVFRSLFRNGETLCPFDSWESYLEKIPGGKQIADGYVSPRNILGVLRATIKWLASSLGLNAEFSHFVP